MWQAVKEAPKTISVKTFKKNFYESFESYTGFIYFLSIKIIYWKSKLILTSIRKKNYFNVMLLSISKTHYVFAF